jgi:hypothetical protein
MLVVKIETARAKIMNLFSCLFLLDERKNLLIEADVLYYFLVTPFFLHYHHEQKQQEQEQKQNTIIETIIKSKTQKEVQKKTPIKSRLRIYLSHPEFDQLDQSRQLPWHLPIQNYQLDKNGLKVTNDNWEV